MTEGHEDAGDRRELLVEAPGADEITVLPWPLLMRARVQGRAQRSGSYPWLVLSAALFGLFTVGFSITVLSIAIEEIAREFDSSRSVLIWVITGPLLLGAIVTPSAGKLADLFGARRVYLCAMILVGFFAGLAALAWSPASLITFRVLGAAIGAATGPASIAIINRLFPAERRAQALGYWSLVAAGGPVLGVVIGGPIVEHFSWRWIFIAQVPLSALTVLVCSAIFPDTPRDRTVKFDFVGALLLALGVGGFVFALNRAPGTSGLGWSHPVVITGFLLAPVCIVAFALYEQRIEHQLVPTRYLRERNFVFPMINQFFANFAYMGGFFLTPFLLENVLGYSASKTGFVSVARPLAFAIAGPLAGWLATKVGERVNGVAGALFIIASMVMFSTVTESSTELIVIFALVLSGVGMGTTAPAMAASIANSVDDRDLGVAGGAQQMLSQIGVVVGTQVMVTVQQATAADGQAASYSKGYLVGAVAALCALAAATFVRRTVHDTPAAAADGPGPGTAVTGADAPGVGAGTRAGRPAGRPESREPAVAG